MYFDPKNTDRSLRPELVDIATAARAIENASFALVGKVDSSEVAELICMVAQIERLVETISKRDLTEQ